LVQQRFGVLGTGGGDGEAEQGEEEGKQGFHVMR
jgi:hypothetical protein